MSPSARGRTPALAAALATALPLLAALPAAADTRCPALFLDGTPPALVAENLRPRTTEVCYSRFAVLDSGLTRTPLWSAELLTSDAVAQAHALEREDSFHPDPNLPPGDRAELSDYKGSGYDRGHMSPNGDMPDVQSQGESFTLGNMVPQDPDNNRRLWAAVESMVRYLTTRTGRTYAVTGPMFSGDKVLSLKGRVLVPTHVWKAVYDPSSRGAAVVIAPNAPGEAFEVVSVAAFRARSGIDPFPSLSEQVKAVAMPLPEVRVRGERRRTSSRERSPGVLGRLYGILTGK